RDWRASLQSLVSPRWGRTLQKVNRLSSIRYPYPLVLVRDSSILPRLKNSTRSLASSTPSVPRVRGSAFHQPCHPCCECCPEWIPDNAERSYLTSRRGVQ